MKNIDIIKIAPVIIRGGKFLIVRGAGQDFWKNVGGVLEEGESELECLNRETKEELSCELEGTAEYYFSTPVTFTVTEPKRTLVIKLYKTVLKGEPRPSCEIEEIHWLSKEDFEGNDYNIAPQIRDYIVPRLISDGLLE
jgi:8-oxo-dGTP diphosphatase